MALNIWTQRSGYEFSSVAEGSEIVQQLPVSYTALGITANDVTFTVISGRVPHGLRLSSDYIIGTPFEVPRTTVFEFVIRASYNGQIADRTFFWTIEGADEPTWVTPVGSLPVGANDQYYILDSSYIDFQLVATDFDTAAGQTLKYFQPKNGGDLPPGLILTEDGRIVGWIQPTLAIPEGAGNGAYDTAIFDEVAYDFGYRPSNGYDSYVYDTVIYDYAETSLTPKKLNRYYEFLVTVTDGDTSSTRQFKIFVVGDDYFRADTVAIGAGDGVFTVDSTYVRAPIWTTASNLGVKRANNYLTFKLDTYKALELGPIIYSLDTVNPIIDGYAYTTLATENKITKNLLRIKNTTGTPVVGNKLCLKDYVTDADATTYNVINVTNVSSTEFILTLSPPLAIGVANNKFIQLGTASTLPLGMQFDQGTAEVFGVVPYQPAITKSYVFTVTATRLSDRGEIANSKRTFSVQVLGEIDSVMTWNTPSNLGSIGANLVSTLAVSASSTVSNSAILYVLESGTLPPGLTLSLDGEIVGKVNQFGGEDAPGILTLDGGGLLLDDGTTTLDKDYAFTIQARDILSYSAISREFTLNIDTPNDRLYSNLIVRPFLKQTQRDLFKDFITDSDVFSIQSIYRPSDPNFGIQKDLKMLVFAGIETKSAAEVAGALGRNHKPKKFKFGAVKKAQAKITGTNTVVYEVVYVEVVDPLETNNAKLPEHVFTGISSANTPITVDQNNEFYLGPFNQDRQFWHAPDPFNVTLDSTEVYAGDPHTNIVFPASISIWRDRIKSLGLKERNYLPLWMRTVQDGSVQELDFVKAVPLCYCKPGTADDIILNIKNREFDFKQIDYVIDRYIIDSVTGYSADKYIAFKNDRTTIS